MKKKTGYEYYTNRHSCFLLQYHIVLVTKYRHPVLTGDVKLLSMNGLIMWLKAEGLIYLS